MGKVSKADKKQIKIDSLVSAPEKFSRGRLFIFVSVFALIGALILIKSLAAPNPNLPGDLNNDNTVNITDMSIMLSNYGTSNSTADINGDGSVNVLDMSILLSHYGQTYTPTQTLTQSTSLANNATISGTYAWQVTTNIPESKVQFFVENVSLSTVTGTTSFTYNLDTTKYTNGAHNGGYWIYDSSGTAVYKSPSINFTVQNGTASGGGTGSPNLTVDGTWEHGLGTFTGVECPNPSTQFAIVTSPVREGTHAAYVHETPNDIWSGNNIVRCLHADYNSHETSGNEYYYRVSMYLPQRLNGNLIWELHHPASLYNLSNCGVAPFAISSNGTGLTFRISTGNCTVGSGYAEWEPNIPIPNLTSQPLNTWIDFAIHIKFTESSTGLVEVYDRIGSGAWGLQVSRSNVPTMPFCNSANVHNVSLYTEMGLYVGAANYTNTDTIYLDDYHRESSLAAVENY